MVKIQKKAYTTILKKKQGLNNLGVQHFFSSYNKAYVNSPLSLLNTATGGGVDASIYVSRRGV
jgi:hypothetical protein